MIVPGIQAQEKPEINFSEHKKLTEEIQTILVYLPLLSGKTIRASNFKDKVVVITFFAS